MVALLRAELGATAPARTTPLPPPVPEPSLQPVVDAAGILTPLDAGELGELVDFATGAFDPTSGLPGLPPAPAIALSVPESTAPFAAPSLLSPPPAAIEPALSSTVSSTEALRRRIDVYLAAAERAGASDLHLHAGQPLLIRVHGRLVQAEGPPLDPRETEACLVALLPDALREPFLRTNDVDFAYVTQNGLRTRANLYRQQGGVDGVFRLVPRKLPSLTELGLPAELGRLTHYPSGLVLITGPAGSGKSTTLNALVDLINGDRSDHVLTVEDPVEFVHTSKQCLVNQRQVQRDTESFGRALKAALREDPDVIVIGELRDHETISLAITAAETGHLVLGSLHTNGAARTISRILDVFPAEQQPQIRNMLSESLRGVISQRLVPTVDGTRALALEVLWMNLAISNLVREDKLHQLRSAMQVGRSQGMRLMEDSLRELVQSGRVAADVARKYVDRGTELEKPPPPPEPVTPPPAGGGLRNILRAASNVVPKKAGAPEAEKAPTPVHTEPVTPAPAGGLRNILRAATQPPPPKKPGGG